MKHPLEDAYRAQLRSGDSMGSAVLDAIEMQFLMALEQACADQEARADTLPKAERQDSLF